MNLGNLAIYNDLILRSFLGDNPAPEDNIASFTVLMPESKVPQNGMKLIHTAATSLALLYNDYPFFAKGACLGVDCVAD
ncbi:hypothetical protein TWF481_003004 [Arthrobotrys musiformis]|uniref:Uncharacterized protein n=1 Tax=Arthrobotrys musiformis TaxID=47236 RepID=A0AAV9VU23_9PEZI